MYFFGIITVYLLLVSCYGDTEDTPVARAFIENKLVPNIVDQAPHKYIRVNYSSVEVKLGNYVNPLQTLFQPDVAYEANEDELFTLMLFGPDLPLDIIPRYTQWLHWLVVNIPGEKIESGDAVAPYFPPTPYPGGFPYLFVLYKQNDLIDPDTLSTLSIFRPRFDPVEFKNNNNLTGPIAGNFMREAYILSLIKN